MHEKEDYDDSLLKETVDNLLSGLSEDEAFKSITITDVTDDVRLINCYRNCNFTDLFSFLKLGRKRMKLRGYGRTSEVRLNLSLTNFLKCNDGIVQENLATNQLWVTVCVCVCFVCAFCVCVFCVCVPMWD